MGHDDTGHGTVGVQVVLSAWSTDPALTPILREALSRRLSLWVNARGGRGGRVTPLLNTCEEETRTHADLRALYARSVERHAAVLRELDDELHELRRMQGGGGAGGIQGTMDALSRRSFAAARRLGVLHEEMRGKKM